LADTPWWERKAAKLVAREWPEILDAWLSYIPTIQPPGKVPDSPLADLPTLQAEVQDLQQQPKVVTTEIIGLREGVLIEGIFLLHKAANVLGSAQVHVSTGLRSWSLSSAYQAAFFAMKAVTHFLGVAVVEVQNKSVLIDIWTPPQKKRKGEVGPSYHVLMQSCNRFEHRQLWAVFQRMMRVTKELDTVLTKDITTALLDLDINDFATQRNSLHYRIAWPFNDLHQCNIDPNFGIHDDGIADGTPLRDPEGDDFSIVLGIVLVRIGYRMIYELSQKAPALDGELDLLRNWLRGDCHPLYQRAFVIE
jgi:hypothetical protein